MTIRAQELFDILAARLAETQLTLSEIRQANHHSPDRLRGLASQRTDAFVDLAQHYLPGLTHKAMASAWGEVRMKIRDLLLQKDDCSRQLRSQLEHLDSRRQAIETRLDLFRAQHVQAELDLASKTGNFYRELRLNPSVSACLSQIERLDAQIDHGILQFESVSAQATKKLPDYEESELFRYLQQRGYGTPVYQARGLERRWDRWVARLIRYSESKKSFDFLTQTPLKMKDLIDEKRDRYLSLLKELDGVREAAESTFGIHEQSVLCQELQDRLVESEVKLESTRASETEVQSQLDAAENIHGDLYHQALEVYREFLKTLDPEVLRVYAECTASPVDDEICARLRGIQEEIATVEQHSTVRLQEISELEEYVTSLHQLTDRLHVYVRRSTIPLAVRSDFSLREHLVSLRCGRSDTSEVWAALRTSIAEQFQIDVLQMRSSDLHDARVTLDESFLSSIVHETQKTIPETADLSGIVLVPAVQSGNDGHKHGYRTLAICRLQVDAAWLVSMLLSNEIRCFVHSSPMSGGTKVAMDSGLSAVMVAPGDLQAARELVDDFRNHEVF